MAFTWTPSLTLMAANERCELCEGIGIRTFAARTPGKPGKQRVCRCALRGIFRTCYGRWRYVQDVSLARMSQIQYGIRQAPSAQAGFSMPDVEYSADFLLLAKRTLTPQQHGIFRLHFLLGAGWAQCCRRLSIDRGSFFHEVYRIEERIGRACAETQPYPLYPLERYFAGVRYKPDTTLPSDESHTPLASAA